MKNLIPVVLLLLMTGTSRGQCFGTPKIHESLQWSEPAKVVSPDRAWVVEVHPVLNADENRSPVTIRNCGESKRSALFTLQRSAELYWSSDSKHVLVVDQPLSGTNKLLLFFVPSFSVGSTVLASDALDKIVNKALIEKLGKGRHIQFYIPTLVSWKENVMLLAVGGESYVEDSGPLDTYCYGLRVNSDTLHIESVLSEKELRASAGRGCQVSP